MRRRLLLVVAATVLAAGQVSAHPGGLDAEGCHTNRKTGERHCHRGSAGPAPSPKPVRPQGLSAARDAFPNCAAARAAGAAPIRRGQPGYGPHLDRDGDACER